MQNSRAVKYYAYGDQALRRMRIFPHDHPCASIPILPVSVITISSQPAENLGFGQPSEDFSCPVAYIHSSISIRISISINTADGQSSASGCIPILSADMFLTEQVKVAAGCGFQVVEVVVVSLYNVHSMYSPQSQLYVIPYPTLYVPQSTSPHATHKLHTCCTYLGRQCCDTCGTARYLLYFLTLAPPPLPASAPSVPNFAPNFAVTCGTHPTQQAPGQSINPTLWPPSSAGCLALPRLALT